VCDIAYYEHITPYYKELKILKIEKRRKFQMGLFMYKLLKTETPSYIFQAYTDNSMKRARNTRNRNKLVIPCHKTTMYHNSFYINSCYVWNSIPKELKDIPSVGNFKKCLFSFYFYET
jgi:hypothetical protein